MSQKPRLISVQKMSDVAARLAERFELLAVADRPHELTPSEMADLAIVLRFLAQELPDWPLSNS